MTLQKVSKTSVKNMAGCKAKAGQESPEHTPIQPDLHPLQPLQHSIGNRAVIQAMHLPGSAQTSAVTVVQRQSKDEDKVFDADKAGVDDLVAKGKSADVIEKIKPMIKDKDKFG